MARYGDILEINGQLVEFTPVGYVPIKGGEGMLTKPAPTTKQTVPVGTPSTPPKQMPGESGPFDPNAPVPTPVPAPAPQQTGPVGVPSSDPTKRQPGETGPFDPNAAPPAPAPEPETELAPPKPLPDTKESVPASAPETSESRLYPFMYSTRDLPSGGQREPWQDQHVDFLTQEELSVKFGESGDLQQAFGSFDNYLSYMNGMLDLAEEHPEIAWWNIGRVASDTGETYDATSDPSSYYYGMEEEDMRSGSTALIDANQDRTDSIKTAIEAMNALPEYQQLLQNHNVQTVLQNNDGDVFYFNGLNSAEIYEVEDHLGVKEIASLGMAIALSVLGTPALANALTSTLGAVGANAAASSIISAATQLLTTGEVDIKDALRSGATSILTGAVLDVIEESGIYDSLQEAVGGTTTDQLLDADGNIIGKIVRDSAGEIISSTGIAADEWYTYATELGGVIQEGQTIAEQLSTVLDVVPDWLYDAGFETAEAINNAFEEAQAGTGTGTGIGIGTGDGEGVSTIPVVDGVRDIFAGDAEQVEQVEEPEEVPPEEDILADTTQEATGFEEGTITEDILGEYLEPIRADITASEQRIINQTQEFLASALANLPPNISQEELRTIVEEIVANAPQAETLSEEQVDVLVNSAVDAIRVDLETAETERQEIRVEQEAIRSELSSDIQSLEERLNNLPPEIREIVAEQLASLEITDDIDSVRQAVTALEEVVSNIQPGTTPEQVAEQIEQADLVTSEELETTAEGLFAAIQAMAEGQTVELTTAQSELLAEITEGDAEVIERLSQYQGQLEDYLEERDITFDTVTGELSSDIERLQQQAEEFESRTEERFEESAQERVEIYQGLLNRLDEFRRGAEVDLSETEIRVLSEVTGVEERLLQQASENAEEFNALLAQQGIQFEEVTDVLRADIATSEQRTGERITGLEERMDANAVEQLAQLTGLRVEFLEGISNVEAAAIASSRGLSDQITEEITGIRGETAAQIEGMSERLTERINEYEAQTGEQLEMAAEERAVLGGQLGTLTSDVARVAEDVIRANGRIEDMDAESRQRYDELGLSIEELSLRVGVNLEALQEGMLTQESAMRELIEETAQQTEERVGVQITGLGEQIAGIGEGVTGLGQALGIGLLGLAGAQPTAQEIAAAMPRQPVKFDPFLKGLSPFQPLTPLSLSPIQEKDATSELNKFIGRQTGMLV